MGPATIPMPNVPAQIPPTFPAYQNPILPGSSAENVLSAQPTQNLSSISSVAQPSASTTSKTLGSKTRIVVPDENISLVAFQAHLISFSCLGRALCEQTTNPLSSAISLNYLHREVGSPSICF